MAVTYGFYNSNDHDRIYDANDFSAIFDGIINDGVFMSVGERFNVKPVDGLGISVGSGRAWFNSTWTHNDADLILSLDPSDMLEGRIDAVVLEINSETRTNSIKVIKGTTSTSPVRPELTNNDSVHQYPLAYVTVDTNATSLAASKIQNVVGLTPTPYVTGILQTANVDNLYSSWEDRFNTWFEGVQGLLDGDVAVNLAASVDSLQRMTAPIPQETKDYIGTDAETMRDLLKPLRNNISMETVVLYGEGSGIFFIDPRVIQIYITCVGPGGNGTPLYSGSSSSAGAGGGAGDLQFKTISAPFDYSYVNYIISDYITSFGNIISCNKGGSYGNSNNPSQTYCSFGGGNSIGMGGGGGGSYGSSSFTSSDDVGSGGNGGVYGGGGGGGSCCLGTSTGVNVVGCGGNGGTYGGGGGGGISSQKRGNGGNGGTYGGNGGSGSSSSRNHGANGTNTIGLNLKFEGEGLGGSSGTSSTYNAGGGGGGYGGNGGNGAGHGSSSTYCASSGGGGGGYGGNGANGSSDGGGGGGGYGKTRPGHTHSGEGYGAGANPGRLSTSYPIEWTHGILGCIVLELIYRLDN